MVTSPLPPNKGQNLIDQAPVVQRTHQPIFWKQLALDVLIVALAVGVSFAYAGYLQKTISFWTVLAAVFLWSVVSLFPPFVTKDAVRRLGVIVLELCALLLSFVFALPLPYVGLAFAVGFILFIWGEESARRDVRTSFEVRFFKTTKSQLAKRMTALVLMGIVLYIPARGDNAFFLSEKVYREFFGASIQTTQRLYPELKLQSSIDDFSKSIALLQLKKDPRFAELPRAEQESTVRTLAEQFVTALNTNLGIKIMPRDSLESVSYAFLSATIERWREKFGDRFAVIWGVIIFFLIRGLASLFSLVIIGMGFLIYQFLLSIRAIQITGETRTREKVEFS